MGGVYRFDARLGGEPRSEQHLGDLHGGRRGYAIDAERARFFAGVVARRENARVSFFTRRRIAGVSAFDGGRRGARVDEILDWRGYGEMVAGREDDCIYVFRVSGLRQPLSGCPKQ